VPEQEQPAPAGEAASKPETTSAIAPAEPLAAPPPARPRIRRGLGYPSDMLRPGTLGPSPLAGSSLIKRLTADGYVFPVYGQSGFGDSFAAPRAEVAWHHGADIFAPLGAPVLAVADGTLFSVGRNRLGGNRFWLRDRAGNEFYYAHLSAYSPLAVNGARVTAGDVIGFVGNTGDADTTPYHLHFEIHPASMLFLGYDGVVNPTPYLRAWQRVLDVEFPSAAVWAPTLVATGATAGSDPAPGLGHLDRERARPRIARRGARPLPGERVRGGRLWLDETPAGGVATRRLP
jgi:murein DD-endopeptidase MepM/ murein hydrolase activator NlpD